MIAHICTDIERRATQPERTHIVQQLTLVGLTIDQLRADTATGIMNPVGPVAVIDRQHITHNGTPCLTLWLFQW